MIDFNSGLKAITSSSSFLSWQMLGLWACYGFGMKKWIHQKITIQDNLTSTYKRAQSYELTPPTVVYERRSPASTINDFIIHLLLGCQR
jgi:hypothetical protein